MSGDGYTLKSGEGISPCSKIGSVFVPVNVSLKCTGLCVHVYSIFTEERGIDILRWNKV